MTPVVFSLIMAIAALLLGIACCVYVIILIKRSKAFDKKFQDAQDHLNEKFKKWGNSGLR